MCSLKITVAFPAGGTMIQLDPARALLSDRQKKDRERAFKNSHLYTILKTHGKEDIEKFLSTGKNIFQIVCTFIFQELKKDPQNLYLIQKLYEFSFYASSAQRKQMSEENTPYFLLAKSPGNPSVLLGLCRVFPKDSELAAWIFEIIFLEEYERREVSDFEKRVSCGTYESSLERLMKSAEFRKDFESIALSAAKESPNSHEFFDTALSQAQQYRLVHTADKAISSIIFAFGAAKLRISKSGEDLKSMELKDAAVFQESATGKKTKEHLTRSGEIDEIQKRISGEPREQKIALYARLIELFSQEERLDGYLSVCRDIHLEKINDEPGVRIAILAAREIFGRKKLCPGFSPEEKIEFAKLVYEKEKTASARVSYGIALFTDGRYLEAREQLIMDNPPPEREGERLFCLGRSYFFQGPEYYSVAIEYFKSLIERKEKGVNLLEALYCLARAYFERKFPEDEKRGLNALIRVLAYDINFSDAISFYKKCVFERAYAEIDYNPSDPVLCALHIPEGISRNDYFTQLEKKALRNGLTHEESYQYGIMLLHQDRPVDALRYFQRGARTHDCAIRERALLLSALIICSDLEMPRLAQSILESVSEWSIIEPRHLAFFRGEIAVSLGDEARAHCEYSRALSLISEKDALLKKDLEEKISSTYLKIPRAHSSHP